MANTAGRSESVDERSVHRMVQFSDGVFTVALTLLVIDIAVPALPSGSSEAELVAQLRSQVPNILAFALTFWVVAAYWLTHHRHFRFIRRYDGRLQFLNLLLLMTICFLPWPTAVLGRYGDEFAAWVLYALSMTATGLAAMALWVYGSGDHGLADGITPELRVYFTARTLVQPTLFLLSIPVALVSLTLAELCWVAMFVALVLLNRTFRNRIARGDMAF